MAETFTYNHADIVRYLHKQMTAEEMHAFERAMMDDPFLADALEGYQLSNQPLAKDHLAKIEEEIRGKEEKAKVIPIAEKNNSWLWMAAVFILLAGSGIIVFKTMNNDAAKREFAKNVEVPQSIQNDSVRRADPPVEKEEAYKNKGFLSQNAKPSTPASSPVVIESQSNQLASGAAAANVSTRNDSTMLAMEDKAYAERDEASSAKRMAVPEMKSRAMNYQNREFRGRVTAPDGGGLPYANVRSSNNVNTMTDNNGNFTIKAPDTVIDVNVSSLGYASANQQIKSDAATNQIVLKEENASLQEVVTVGMSAKKEKKALAKDSKEPMFNETKTAGAEPEGGWQSFQDYVYSNLKKVRDTSDTYTTGDVLVEFNIDEKGKPKNITVAQTVSKESADQAVQIIEKGPKWKRSSKNKKAKVVIKF